MSFSSISFSIFLLYGGSINTTSKTLLPFNIFIALSTEFSITRALSDNLVNIKLSFMHLTAFLLFSTKTAYSAPLLSASIPIAPLPLNKSRKLQSSISFCSILKSVSLILSVVGLVPIPSTVFNCNLLALPAITLT